MAKVPNGVEIAENFNRLSRVHECYRQRDRRQHLGLTIYRIHIYMFMYLYRTLTRTKARTVHVFVMVVHVQVTMQYNI